MARQSPGDEHDTNPYPFPVFEDPAVGCEHAWTEWAEYGSAERPVRGRTCTKCCMHEFKEVVQEE